jgi:hypothetical protein
VLVTKLRWHVIGLLICLACFFQLERLSVFTGWNLAIVPPGTSFIGLLAAVLPLLPIGNDRAPAIRLSAPILLYAGVLAWYGVPFAGGSVALLLGLVLLLVTAYLSARVAQDLREFARAVELVTLALPHGQQPLRNLEEARATVDVEMVRSRRFERPLSLVVIQIDPAAIRVHLHRLIQEMQHALVQRYVVATMAHLLTRTLRRTDLVVADGCPGRLLLVTPETNALEAGAVGSRAVQLIRERMGLSVRYGVASFPQQALTFEDLRGVAEADLYYEAAPNTEAEGEQRLEFDRRTRRAVPEPERVRV